MGKRKTRKAAPVPQLRRHNRSKRAYARFNGKDVPFGAWRDAKGQPDAEAKAKYDQFVAQWLARGRKLEEPKASNLSVERVVARYLLHLEQLHDEKWHRDNGTRLDLALDPLLNMYGIEEAEQFSPLMLKAIRHSMIAGGRLGRSEVNARISIQKAVFKWAASEELVSPSVWHGISTVENLKVGEYDVREGKPRGSVSEEVVFATIPYLHPVAAAIVELLWWTGARPSEIFNLCPQDIVKGGASWYSEPRKHKTARMGKRRTIPFGPQAQRILQRFLNRVPTPEPSAPLFSPRLGVAEHKAERRRDRQTPLWDSHEERYERERAERKADGRERRLLDRYDAGTLRLSIRRALARANHKRRRAGQDKLPHWTPYQIRHAALTRVRRAKGEEAAAVIGGHSKKSMTDHYTVEAIRDLALDIAAEVG